MKLNNVLVSKSMMESALFGVVASIAAPSQPVRDDADFESERQARTVSLGLDPRSQGWSQRAIPHCRNRLMILLMRDKNW